MKQLIIAFVLFVTISGCSAIEAGKIEGCFQKATDVTNLICATGKIFESAGINFPGVSQCEEVMRKADAFLGSPEYRAIAETARCVDKFDRKSVEFVQCIDNVDGIQLLVKKISKRVR